LKINKQDLIFCELEQAEELKKKIEGLEALIAFYKTTPTPPLKGGELSKEIGWYCERKRDELVSNLYKSIRELEQLKFE
jgi:hypothetical protein